MSQGSFYSKDELIEMAARLREQLTECGKENRRLEEENRRLDQLLEELRRSDERL